MAFFSFLRKIIYFSGHQKYLLPELCLCRDIRRTVKGFVVSNYIMRKLVSSAVTKINLFH